MNFNACCSVLLKSPNNCFFSARYPHSYPLSIYSLCNTTMFCFVANRFLLHFVHTYIHYLFASTHIYDAWAFPTKIVLYFFPCSFVCLPLFQYLYSFSQLLLFAEEVEKKASLHGRNIYRKNSAEEIAWCFRGMLQNVNAFWMDMNTWGQCIKKCCRSHRHRNRFVQITKATIVHQVLYFSRFSSLFRLIIDQNLIKTEMRIRDAKPFTWAQ